MRKWNEPEITYLKTYWPLKTAKEIGEELKFSPGAVSAMASKLGLKKSKAKRHELQRRSLLLSKYSFHHQYLDALSRGEDCLVGYTTRPAILGGQAERRFAFLFPEAIDANRDIHINNPDYDFIYKGMTIDVKYASISMRRDIRSEIWTIRTSGKRDMIVAFLEKERGRELEDPYVLVIPQGAVSPRQKIEVHRGGKWWKLIVDETDLQAVLDEYATRLN